MSENLKNKLKKKEELTNNNNLLNNISKVINEGNIITSNNNNNNDDNQLLVKESLKTFKEKKIKERIEKREARKMFRINQQVSLIEELRQRLDSETPPCGYYSKISDEDNETIPINLRPKIYFKNLAISDKTLKGLNYDKKYKLTPIQRASIPHALYNRDILGASKTGSGKTLAFVIPLLEKLYLSRWSSLDGLGGLIVVPTRELAIQVFEVIKTIGKFHDFSLGLIIGGNNLRVEQSMLNSMNILVGTPGRILQHITETPYFNPDNLQMLIIDEADEILKEGFANDLNEIMSYLPKDKQTLMFSATLTKNIKALAKFNLKCPEYISINNIENLMMFNNQEQITNNSLSKINIELKNEGETSNKVEKDSSLVNSLMPKSLLQFYTIVEPENKINVLYSFLNTHKNAKAIVFVTSCKQVRYYYETFRKLKLGFTFLELHGNQKQSKRTAIYYNFLEKANSVLFCTDIGSRGMDFPSINWVVQVDVPDCLETYIHRVGRTARYKSAGNSLLFVSIHEKEYLNVFKNKNIPIKPISINKDKLVNLQPILRSILSENPDINYLAQRALVNYYKSVAYNKNKNIFDHKKIDINKLSQSLGLMIKPKIITKDNKNNDTDVKVNDNFDSNDEDDNNINAAKKTKLEKFKEKIKKKKEQKAKQSNLINNTNNNLILKDNETDFIKKKRKISISSQDKESINRDVELNKKTTVNYNQNVSGIKNSNKLAEDRYKTINTELKLKESEYKQLDKLRVKEKHRQQRQESKYEDYKKHGLEMSSSNEESSNESECETDKKTTLSNKPIKTNYTNKENIAKDIIKQGNKSKLLF